MLWYPTAFRAHTRPPLVSALAILVLLGMAGACASGTSEPPPAAGDSRSTAADASAPATPDAAPADAASGSPSAAGELPAPSREAAEAALKSYEVAREDLASDRTDGLAKTAEEIGLHAKTALQGAPENLKPSFDRLVASSARLKNSATGKIDDARAAFGELSEAVVALLGVEPSLARGRFVFECPMTDTYKKWVQVDDQIKNPYMGKRMPGCGMASTWD